MSTRSSLLILCLCSTLVVTAVCAEELWWSGYGPDNLWTRYNNWWSNRVPGRYDQAGIGSGGYAVINHGQNASCNILVVGNWMNNTQWCYLDVKGGVLTVYDRAVMGNWGHYTPNDGGAGCMIIRDGATVNVHGDVWVRREGHGILEMKGGVLNVDKTLWVSYSAVRDRHGHLQLDAGTINAGGFRMYTPKASMDITGGAMIIDDVGDSFLTMLEGYIAEGAITAYDGRGKVVIDRGNINPHKTTVTAIMDPDFNRDKIVDANDFAQFARHWRTSDGAPHFDDACDLNADDTIGLRDLELFADRWLWHEGPLPYTHPVIELDETIQYQEMDGFGGSFTESSAWLMYEVLTPAQRHNAMVDLFDPVIGIGLSYLRQPMGSSDFRLSDYTCDDIPPGQTDYQLEHFSVDRDKQYIIPILAEATAINPDIKIMASPWSAPAWMKDSGQLGFGRLKNDNAVYETYADYFVRFVQAYDANNLTIDAITLQNEPHYEPYSYPGMRMEPSDQARLATLIGRKFHANNIDTKIIIWDHNWDEPDYPIAVLNDPIANPYIAGAAFHAYAGQVSAQSEVKTAHPDKDIYFTECSGGQWSPDFRDNLIWDTTNLIIDATRNWAKTVVKWNMALDENGGPKAPGGCGNCRGVITVNQSTGQVIKGVSEMICG